MRIIAGKVGGRTLKAPAGRNTRPTSDRVREALFSIIEARLDLEGVLVLDLFAGSGALGLEALSRGAASATLVDEARTAQQTIASNADQLGLAGQCTLLRLEVGAALALLEREGRRFDLVLADPPYADDPDVLLEEISRRGLLADGGLLLLEHSRRTTPAERCGELALVLRRRYGDTQLSLYQRAEGALKDLAGEGAEV